MEDAKKTYFKQNTEQKKGTWDYEMTVSSTQNQVCMYLCRGRSRSRKTVLQQKMRTEHAESESDRKKGTKWPKFGWQGLKIIQFPRTEMQNAVKFDG